MPLENEKIEVAEEKETEMPNVEELLKILLDVNLEQNRQTVHCQMIREKPLVSRTAIRFREVLTLSSVITA